MIRPQSRHGAGAENLLLDELFRRDLEKLERRELQQRDRHVQHCPHCWAMRTGGIFAPPRGNCVWYLQHQHLLLAMLWDFVSSQFIVLSQLGEIERDPLCPAGHN